MIHLENGKLMISGSGVELLSEIGVIASRLVYDLDCPPDLLISIIMTALQEGVKRSSKDDDTCVKSTSVPLPKDLKERFENCTSAEEAKELFRQYKESQEDKDDSIEHLMFKKMFGDLFNE